MMGKNSHNIYLFINPDGEFYLVHCLSQFALEHNLSRPNLIKVSNGERPAHKGWCVIKLYDGKKGWQSFEK